MNKVVMSLVCVLLMVCVSLPVCQASIAREAVPAGTEGSWIAAVALMWGWFKYVDTEYNEWYQCNCTAFHCYTCFGWAFAGGGYGGPIVKFLSVINLPSGDYKGLIGHHHFLMFAKVYVPGP